MATSIGSTGITFGNSTTQNTNALINTQTFNSNGTWTKPSGYSATSRVLIQAWGGGGSGGRNSTSINRTGGGGGGGYNEAWFNLSELGSTETVTVGAGGAARTSNLAGATGGNSSVGSKITAYGGAGGGSQVSPPGGGGGGQLSAASSSTPGDPLITSQVASEGVDLSIGEDIIDYVLNVIPAYAGEGAITRGSTSSSGPYGTAGTEITDAMEGFFHGGGGGGITTGTGAKSVYGGGGGGGAVSGAAGGISTFGGNGGAAGSTATGVAGTQPGGGGGGATSTSGAGGAGRVIITVFAA